MSDVSKADGPCLDGGEHTWDLPADTCERCDDDHCLVRCNISGCGAEEHACDEL